MKDNFSRISELYARFRPKYPAELYDFLLSLVPQRQTAWDCGTGNGQVAVELASHFDKVFATDISENQIRHAVRKTNVEYRIERAEQTTFADSTFDLVTVGQAVHWFGFDAFYKEVWRTLKTRGVLAVFGYQIPTVDPQTDHIVHDFYSQTLDSYWDEERKYVNEGYRTIPFPFQEIIPPEFTFRYGWNLEDFIGYVSTWSAVQHYIERNNVNPAEKLANDLKRVWYPHRTKNVVFSVISRIGIKPDAAHWKSEGTRIVGN